MFILSALLSMVCVFGAAYAWEPKCDSLGFQIIPKPDCSGYYLCVFGKPVPMPNCPPGSIFSNSAHVCVPENSIYDDCKDYNGGRPVIPDLGDYRRNLCPVAHCVPCSVRMPSCEGKEDGIHANENRLWSPYHVMCYKDRFVSSDMCKADGNGRAQLFHPVKNQCVSLDEIPQEHGGMMPDCVGKKDGYYLDDFGRCDRYSVCKDGKYLNAVQCNAGEVFDAFTEKCLLKEKACGPCGDLSNC
ncbi:chitin binding [Mactra antiquata]